MGTGNDELLRLITKIRTARERLDQLLERIRSERLMSQRQMEDIVRGTS
jgi:hypothetical protein